MSRLLRETNPLPGEKPGFLPQHLDANGNLVPTGENNPHPTNDKEVKAAIETLQTNIAELKSQINELNQSVMDNNTVQIGNFPNVQNVADKDTQDMLLVLQQELQNNNTKLEMIEGYLKNGIDTRTQLTGSKVEEYSDTLYTVPANSHIDIRPNEPIEKYHSFNLLGRMQTGSFLDLGIELELRASSARNGISFHRGRLYFTEKDFDVYSNTLLVSKIFPVSAPVMVFRLKNNTSEPITLDFSIFWRG